MVQRVEQATANTAVNVCALCATIQGWFEWLPTTMSTLASLAGLIWCCLLIYENKTFKRIFHLKHWRELNDE